MNYLSFLLGILFSFSAGASICEEALGKSEEALHREYLQILADIQQIAKPGGHGLTSEDFAGVLRDGGLMINRTQNGWDTQTISISDLNQSDGLLASLGFATRNDFSSYAITSQEFTGRDVVDRYLETNPMYTKSGFILKHVFKVGLRAVALRFANDRPMGEGNYPIYLVLDMEGIDVEYVRPTQIPSELRTIDTIPLSRIRLAMVPFKYMNSFEAQMKEVGIYNIRIYPLELLEAEDIRMHKSAFRATVNRAKAKFSAPFYLWLSSKM